MTPSHSGEFFACLFLLFCCCCLLFFPISNFSKETRALRLHSCIHFLLLDNKLSQIQWLKTTHVISLFRVSGFWAWFSRVFYSGSHKTVIKMSTGLHSHLEAWLVKNTLLSSLRLLTECIFLWLRAQLLTCFWYEDCPQVLETVFHFLACGPIHRKFTWLFASSRPTRVSHTPVS